MRSIRTFTYAASLLLSLLTVQPSLAAAEHAAGHFTLTHEVQWQKQALPAGEYAFSLEPKGPAEFLILRGLDGAHVSAMMLVSDVQTSKPTGLSRLVLVSQDGHSFVRAMELPEFGMVLHFPVPAEREEGVLTAKSAAGASSAR